MSDPDWRLLLIKYALHVDGCEGSDFLAEYYSGSPLVPSLTAKELRLIRNAVWGSPEADAHAKAVARKRERIHAAGRRELGRRAAAGVAR